MSINNTEYELLKSKLAPTEIEKVDDFQVEVDNIISNQSKNIRSKIENLLDWKNWLQAVKNVCREYVSKVLDS